LIEAATAVFAEHGYDAATTREVGERAGCSEGLIHRYFSGKRGLLLAVMESKGRESVQAFRPALPDRETVHEEIEQTLLWNLTDLWERRDFMRVSVSQAVIDPEVGRQVRDRIHHEHVRQVMEKLGRHRDVGRLRDDVDLEATAHVMAGLGFWLGFIAQVAFGMDREFLRQLAAGVAAAISEGIAPPPPPDTSHHLGPKEARQ
jgi:AcrR family transcriptional regulator